MATTKTEKKGLYTEDTYKIMLPISNEKQDDVFVSVNGKTYQIQRGKEVEVPACVYEVLMNSQKMDALALERSRALQNA